VLYRMTSNVEPCNDGANSPTSKRPLRPSWLNYTNASLRSKQSRPQRPTVRSGSFPPSPWPTKMWPLWLCSWTHCMHPLPMGWARCINNCRTSSPLLPWSRQGAKGHPGSSRGRNGFLTSMDISPQPVG
jgi:hypothetical protein